MDIITNRESRAKKMVLGHTLVNWEEITHRDQVSEKLIGDISYWDSAEFKGMSPLDIELQILRDVDQYKWHEERPYGKPMWEHLCGLMKIKNPTKTDILPGLYDTAQAFCILMGTGGYTLSQIGARSMTKTGGNVRLMDGLMWVKPDKSLMFVSTPTEKSSGVLAWGDYRAIANDSQRNYPGYFPKYQDYDSKKINYIKGDDKFGVAEVRTTAEAGNYQGLKAKESVKESLPEGWLIVFCEEINKHPRSAYNEIEGNLTTNDNFCFINAFNWHKNDDQGAVVTRPDYEYSGIHTHVDLDIDKDLVYDSIGEGITIRFDGLKSINILAGKNLTPYTFFNQRDLDMLTRRYGTEHGVFKSQARAYPDAQAFYDTVLPQSALVKSRYNKSYNIRREIAKFSFLDAAFEGKDSPEYAWLTMAEISFSDGTNEPRIDTCLLFQDYVRTLDRVQGTVTYNDYWFDRLEKAGLSTEFVELGEKVSISDQLVIQVAEKNNELGIPHDHHGFDFSMNDEIMTSYRKFLGQGPKSINYNMAPDGILISHRNENSKDFCYNRRDEIFYFAASLFHAQKVRGGPNGAFIESPCTDLIHTRYQQRGKKIKVESNADYKAHSMNGSPDKMVAMIGCMEMARLRGGFSATSITPDLGSSGFRGARSRPRPRAKRRKDFL